MEYFRIVEVSSTEEKIHQPGMDSNFILWSLAFVLSVSLFIVILRKIGQPIQTKESDPDIK
ncbi:MAG: hypothetical protein E4H10_13460 [Bacteroidia bacterium]|nr:MAG: hypothetical protein E4H10_13460 [Bacteroidia bacterium]